MRSTSPWSSRHDGPALTLSPPPALPPRPLVYSFLFKEGVLTCQKDVKKEKHHELDLPNLHVCKAMLSMKSRGYVREVFNWCVCPPVSRAPSPHTRPSPLPPPPSPSPLLSCRQWHYYFLTDTGIAYLKEYLHLPEDVVPATLKKGAGGDAQEGVRGPFGGGDRERRPYGDRPPRPAGGTDGYRRPAPAGAQ